MVIRKLSGKMQWRLYSKDSSRNLGTFPSKELALQHERQVQFFKHRKKVM
jgi:hypothetical protein